MNSRKSLFPDSSLVPLHFDSSLSFLFGNKSEKPNQDQSLNAVLGGNLHQLKPEQVWKIILTKYNNDPIQLIQQLSLDLMRKETELVVLRQEKFRREQKLYKLLQKLGNLSTIEIDQELNQVDDKLNKNIDHIIHDMIQVAIDDEIVPTTPKEKSKERFQTNKKRQDPSKNVKDSKYKDQRKSKSKIIEKSDNQQPPESKNSYFSRTNSLTEISIPKAPVELQNFRSQLSLQHPGPEKKPNSSRLSLLVQNEEVDIDKYGFVKEVRSNTPMTIRSSTSSPSPNNGQHPEPSNESSAILINNHNSHSKLHLIDQLKQISQIHDSTNLYIEKEWESLINDINRQFYTNYYQNNGPKQDDGHKNSNTNNDNNNDDRELYWKFGVRGSNLLQLKNHQQLYSSFINLINQYGIPNKYRRILWLELSGANNIRINGEYQELQLQLQVNNQNNDEINALIQSNIEQIDLDLHRTLPSNFYFNNFLELKPGIKFYKLQRILYTFVKRNPHVGYVQGMNKIVGTLLLLDDDNNNDKDKDSSDGHDDLEEDIFWLFIGLVEEILPKYTCNDKIFFNSIDEIYQDNLILKKLLLPDLLPDLSIHLNKFNIEIEILSMNWWLTLFIDLKFIELDTWFKIFDNLLITNIESNNNNDEQEEKQKDSLVNYQRIILPAMTLAIFKNLENHLISLNSRDLIYQFLNHGDDKFKFKIKFNDLMKYYIYFSKRKEVLDAFR